MLRSIARAIGVVLLSLIFSGAMALLFINWMLGCGERFPTADGSYVQGECLTPQDVALDLFTGRKQ